MFYLVGVILLLIIFLIVCLCNARINESLRKIKESQNDSESLYYLANLKTDFLSDNKNTLSKQKYNKIRDEIDNIIKEIHVKQKFENKELDKVFKYINFLDNFLNILSLGIYKKLYI